MTDIQPSSSTPSWAKSGSFEDNASERPTLAQPPDADSSDNHPTDVLQSSDADFERDIVQATLGDDDAAIRVITAYRTLRAEVEQLRLLAQDPKEWIEEAVNAVELPSELRAENERLRRLIPHSNGRDAL
jgi:hypothetical protein